MKIYDSNGYVNIRGILSEGYPFNFLVGGRGTGKTYTSLRIAYEDKIRFMLMRRTQAQADLISKPEFSVYKPINEDLGIDIRVHSISKYNAEFYTEDEDGTQHPIGYTCALSTISNMRGYDASDINLIIYDEFIPEKHERLLKNEADALFNAYETMNRNRELKGRDPIQLLCLANANDITNPVFESLNLIRISDKMQRGNTDRWTDDRRGIQLIMLHRSPISKKKSGTALYNLTSGSDFAAMALDNDFNVNRQHVQPRPISEYLPVCRIGELCVYRHKSENRLYATTHLSGVFHKTFTTSDSDKLFYQQNFRGQWDCYVSGRLDFEDVTAEKLFLRYWDV